MLLSPRPLTFGPAWWRTSRVLDWLFGLAQMACGLISSLLHSHGWPPVMGSYELQGFPDTLDAMDFPEGLGKETLLVGSILEPRILGVPNHKLGHDVVLGSPFVKSHKLGVAQTRLSKGGRESLLDMNHDSPTDNL
eukprot:jgi/Botrbrau1/18090/Bobra.0062s0075.1